MKKYVKDLQVGDKFKGMVTGEIFTVVQRTRGLTDLPCFVVEDSKGKRHDHDMAWSYGKAETLEVEIVKAPTPSTKKARTGRKTRIVP